MAAFARHSSPSGRTRSGRASAREEPGRVGGGEEPRLLVGAAAHVRERQAVARLAPAGCIDRLDGPELAPAPRGLAARRRWRSVPARAWRACGARARDDAPVRPRPRRAAPGSASLPAPLRHWPPPPPRGRRARNAIPSRRFRGRSRRRQHRIRPGHTSRAPRRSRRRRPPRRSTAPRPRSSRGTRRREARARCRIAAPARRLPEPGCSQLLGRGPAPRRRARPDCEVSSTRRAGRRDRPRTRRPRTPRRGERRAGAACTGASSRVRRARPAARALGLGSRAGRRTRPSPARARGPGR